MSFNQGIRVLTVSPVGALVCIMTSSTSSMIYVLRGTVALRQEVSVELGLSVYRTLDRRKICRLKTGVNEPVRNTASQLLSKRKY